MMPPEGLFTIPVDAPLHACAGDACRYCATRDGTAAATAGIRAVKRDQEWWYRADEWLVDHPRAFHFTADDLVDAIGKPVGPANQIGARFRAWSAARLVAKAGYSTAKRRSSHGRAVVVWERW